jgi:hypothetical protein
MPAMRHEATFISDDIRFEAGHKISLLGLYEQSIVFQSLPARLLKLSFYQRWLEVSHLTRVRLEVRGVSLGNTVIQIEGKSMEKEESKVPHAIRITLTFGPIDMLKVGKVEFLTFFDDESSPSHKHELEVLVDPDLKIPG